MEFKDNYILPSVVVSLILIYRLCMLLGPDNKIKKDE